MARSVQSHETEGNVTRNISKVHIHRRHSSASDVGGGSVGGPFDDGLLAFNSSDESVRTI
jgi:hypothetical protein